MSTVSHFAIEQNKTGRYVIRDTRNGMTVRFSFQNPPAYNSALEPPTSWGNFYAALGFAQRLIKMETGICTE